MTGITKREPPISWRPSPAARVKLARLVSETGLSRNELLNQAFVQYREDVVPVINKPDNVTVEAVKFPPGEPKKITPYRPVVGPDKIAKPQSKDTRTPQERMDDFYRANMAKGKK